jgi:hypothetical protein
MISFFTATALSGCAAARVQITNNPVPKAASSLVTRIDRAEGHLFWCQRHSHHVVADKWDHVPAICKGVWLGFQ